MCKRRNREREREREKKRMFVTQILSCDSLMTHAATVGVTFVQVLEQVYLGLHHCIYSQPMNGRERERERGREGGREGWEGGRGERGRGEGGREGREGGREREH